jgi:acyl-CoA thioester hydrolase
MGSADSGDESSCRMTPPALAAFPVVLTDSVAWSDMDAFQHVSNLVYFRWFQEARIEYMTRLGWFELRERTGYGPIVASTQARYRRPLAYPDTIRTGARILETGKDRVTFEHRIYSERWKDELVAEGQAVIVGFDYRTGRKAELPLELIEAIAQLQSGYGV